MNSPMQRYGISMDRAARARTRRAELAGGLGAGVLGAGLGLLLPLSARTLAIPIALIGLVSHGWGMYQKHRLEATPDDPPIWWAELTFWVCWIGLATASFLLISRLF